MKLTQAVKEIMNKKERKYKKGIHFSKITPLLKLIQIKETGKLLKWLIGE